MRRGARQEPRTKVIPSPRLYGPHDRLGSILSRDLATKDVYINKRCLRIIKAKEWWRDHGYISGRINYYRFPKRRLVLHRMLGPVRANILVLLVELEFAPEFIRFRGAVAAYLQAHPELVTITPEAQQSFDAYQRLVRMAGCALILCQLGLVSWFVSLFRFPPGMRYAMGSRQPEARPVRLWLNPTRCRTCARLWRLLLRLPAAPYPHPWVLRWRGLKADWLFFGLGLLFLWAPFSLLSNLVLAPGGIPTPRQTFFDLATTDALWFLWGTLGWLPLVIFLTALIFFGPGLPYARGPLRKIVTDLDALADKYTRLLAPLLVALALAWAIAVFSLFMAPAWEAWLDPHKTLSWHWVHGAKFLAEGLSLAVGAVLLRGWLVGASGYLGPLPLTILSSAIVALWAVARAMVFLVVIVPLLKVLYGCLMAGATILILLL